MKLKLLTITAALVAANVNASEVAVSAGVQNTTGAMTEKGFYNNEGVSLGVEHIIPTSDWVNKIFPISSATLEPKQLIGKPLSFPKFDQTGEAKE